jgi:hypothetical protein
LSIGLHVSQGHGLVNNNSVDQFLQLYCQCNLFAFLLFANRRAKIHRRTGIRGTALGRNLKSSMSVKFRT